MTDYEAAYENVMRYMTASVSDIDTQEKLKRYFRSGDYRNTMSDKFIDKIVETEAAKEDLSERRSREEITRREIHKHKAVKTEKRIISETAHTPTGTFTTKTGKRHAIYKNHKGQEVYLTTNKKGIQNARDTKTGRFAAKN
jgi:hypothetical protein